MEKLRVGVIGAGMAFERLHYPAFSRLSDEYQIVALSDIDVSKVKDMANRIKIGEENTYADYNEMLKRDDIDVVDIIVPIEQNFIVSQKILESGKNFIVEKPLAPNREDADKFLELKSKSKSKVLVAENFRYNQENIKIKELIGSQKIGDVVYFIKNNVSNFPEEMAKDTYAAREWRQHPKYFGGTFLDAGIHDIGALRFIFGEVECIQAFGKPQKEDYSPYLSVATNILFKSGVTGNYSYCSSCVENQKPLVGFRIFGTKGEIYLEDKMCGTINISYNDGKSEKMEYTPGEGIYNELLNFYKSMKGTEQIAVTPEVEYKDAEIIFDIFDSISSKKIIYPKGISYYN